MGGTGRVLPCGVAHTCYPLCCQKMASFQPYKPATRAEGVFPQERGRDCQGYWLVPVNHLPANKQSHQARILSIYITSTTLISGVCIPVRWAKALHLFLFQLILSVCKCLVKRSEIYCPHWMIFASNYSEGICFLRFFFQQIRSSLIHFKTLWLSFRLL